jgi:hypothetical protein
VCGKRLAKLKDYLGPESDQHWQCSAVLLDRHALGVAHVIYPPKKTDEKEKPVQAKHRH